MVFIYSNLTPSPTIETGPKLFGKKKINEEQWLCDKAVNETFYVLNMTEADDMWVLNNIFVGLTLFVFFVRLYCYVLID